MVQRVDPARTGVKAGRVVGLLTAIIVVVSLLSVRESFVGRLASLVRLLGVDPGLSVSVYFWGYTVSAALGRYGLGYVVGSLIGVVYDWLDRPPVWVLVGMVLAIGLVDGVVAAFDTRSTVIGAAYVGAWLCYVPVFVWLFDDEQAGSTSR